MKEVIKKVREGEREGKNKEDKKKKRKKEDRTKRKSKSKKKGRECYSYFQLWHTLVYLIISAIHIVTSINNS
jgi:hypothetical protein